MDMSADQVIHAITAIAVDASSNDAECDIEAVLVFIAMLQHRISQPDAFLSWIQFVYNRLKAANKSLTEITMLCNPKQTTWAMARVYNACATQDIRRQIRQCCKETGFRFQDDPVHFGKAFILARTMVRRPFDWMPILVAAKRFQDVNNLQSRKFIFLFANMHDTAVSEAAKLGISVPVLYIQNLTFRVLGVYATDADNERFIASLDEFIQANARPEHTAHVDLMRWNFALDHK
jgi:hypothetical protein